MTAQVAIMKALGFTNDEINKIKSVKIEMDADMIMITTEQYVTDLDGTPIIENRALKTTMCNYKLVEVYDEQDNI